MLAVGVLPSLFFCSFLPFFMFSCLSYIFSFFYFLFSLIISTYVILHICLLSDRVGRKKGREDEISERRKGDKERGKEGEREESMGRTREGGREGGKEGE